MTRYVEESAVQTMLRSRTMCRPTFSQDLHAQIAFEDDYHRFATHALALQRVLDTQIEGAIAEVGVWRGDMARFLHALAPDRTYYLFDTFEGFPEEDLETGPDDRFSNTSLEHVMGSLHDTTNVVPRVGYVPETFAGLESERFAFVLSDTDLYAPTKATLEFCYPRMTTGAYMFIHDYNNTESGWACKRAVDEFMANVPEQVVEIADHWGTAMFRKV
jgi:O-methyltransferase